MINTKPTIKAIVAVNNLGYIGKAGKLMWKSKEDFKHFKKSTMGGIMIVGRKTYENDFGGVGLPGRTCIVIGSNHYSPIEAIDEAIKQKAAHELASQISGEVKCIDIWIVGGGSIYEQLMPFIDEFHVSRINDDQEGDVKIDISSFKGTLIEYKFEVNEPI
jgi:dihydrofolate reductase